MRTPCRYALVLVFALLGLLVSGPQLPLTAVAQEAWGTAEDPSPHPTPENDAPRTWSRDGNAAPDPLPAAATQAAPATPVAAPSPPVQEGDAAVASIAQPADLVAAAADSSGARVAYVAPAATGDDGGPARVRCNPPSGSRFPLGTTEVTCWIRGTTEGRIAVTFIVTVTDQTPPRLGGVTDVVVDAAGASGATVDFDVPTAQDNVDGAVAVACDTDSGAFFPVGRTVVTCRAQDAAGNAANPASFAITVNPPLEPTPSAPPPIESPTARDTPATEPTEVPSPPTVDPQPTRSVSEELVSTGEHGSADAAERTPTPTEIAVETSPAAEATDPPVQTVVPTTAAGEPMATWAPRSSSAPTPTPKPDGETSDPRTAPTPEALPLDQSLLNSFVLVNDGGPLGVLTSIWGGLDFPISQEFGHTDFSVTHHSWYAYGTDYGLDGYEHPGLDIGMPRGTALYSPVDGVVEISGNTPYYTYYGNGKPNVGELLIETKNGDQVILGHMGRIAVDVGDHVKVGQFVGLSGGDNGDHLHLEARERQPLGGFKIVDPRKSFLVDVLEAAADVADRPAGA